MGVSDAKCSIMYKIARLISFVFGPPIVPVYGMAIALWLSMLRVLPLSTRLWVLGVVALMICVVPLVCIWALWKLGHLSDPALKQQNERTLPYIITLVSYAACAGFLYVSQAPMWLVMFMVGAMLAVIICTLVNRKWKISAHMTVMGGLMALTMRMAVSHLCIVDMIWPMVIVTILCGMVGTSRLIMQRHTLGQVLAGFAVGFLCVYLCSGIPLY